MANKIEAPFYPIVYVRGYAATMSEIEETVATPYMGFNLGSTKLRQSFDGKPVRFIFESPLIRLMKDFKYQDCYMEGDYPRSPAEGGQTISPKSIWVFRYYEPVSGSLGSGDRIELPEFAADLRKFILRVRDSVCGDDAARAAFKVNLVAHSMGGLVCRCYLQNICRHGVEADPKRNAALELTADGGDSLVHKVFTYATPHNGIDLMGVNVPDIGPLDSVHVRNFNREYIGDYLKLSDAAKRQGKVNSLDGVMDPERFFCLVGTNYRDYQAFFGLSKKGTGAMSDGLVVCENAYVEGAPRAYVHRSHSGHYGIVNSEEGYQNLRRFLFGQTKVDAYLKVDEITLPRAIQKLKDDGKKIRASYYIESTAKVRGGNVNLHERGLDQESAGFKTYERLVGPPAPNPVYLFSGFLDRKAKGTRTADTALAFAVQVAVKVPLYEVDNRFWFDDHFEGADVFNETFTFQVRFGPDGARVKYGLMSKDGSGEANKVPPVIARDGATLRIEIPVGFKEGQAARNPGKLRGTLILTAKPSA